MERVEESCVYCKCGYLSEHTRVCVCVIEPIHLQACVHVSEGEKPRSSCMHVFVIHTLTQTLHEGRAQVTLHASSQPPTCQTQMFVA